MENPPPSRCAVMGWADPTTTYGAMSRTLREVTARSRKYRNVRPKMPLSLGAIALEMIRNVVNGIIQSLTVRRNLTPLPIFIAFQCIPTGEDHLPMSQRKGRRSASTLSVNPRA